MEVLRKFKEDVWNFGNLKNRRFESIRSSTGAINKKNFIRSSKRFESTIVMV